MRATKNIEEELSKMIVETGLEKKDCLEIFQMFFEDLPSQFIIIEDALDNSDFLRLQSISHQLKGASGSLRLKSLHSLMQEIELAAKGCNYSLGVALLKRIKEQVRLYVD